MNRDKILLVGDNPFHGVSHLSQSRARERSLVITNPEYCANLIKMAMENGADGFMFSVSEMTLNIVRVLTREGVSPRLYAIAPAASDYVRLASKYGTPGMAMHLARQILVSGNLKAAVNGLKGVVGQDQVSLMKAYLYYELHRIRAVSKKAANPYCFLLHEIVTEMALALNLAWLFQSYVKFLLGLNIKPGFETRNSPMLIERLTKWGVDLDKIVIVAPFNKVGFQMSPSREECEKTLLKIPHTEVIAMSILASGYVPPIEAIDYIKNVRNIKGIVVGVSKEQHSRDFKMFQEALGKN